MRILALEGYMGGSHKAFLDGWVANSRHEWTLLALPPNKWKWRMRHGAITFARQVNKRIAAGESWDVLFCSDMLNLAEFCGLVDQPVRDMAKVVYFHENQLTYPVRFESERDYQYVMTNFTTATAADAVWFNSAFHRDEFLTELAKFLKRMPDNQPLDAIDEIRAKSAVHPPGIDPFERRDERKPGPPRILWAARWEHDKKPEDFFAAIRILKEKGLDFRISAIGEQFRELPEVFGWAKDYFADQIDRWGYQQSAEEYREALTEADIIVSTANHEFFGISVVEAIAAGAHPILPNRLAYPEIIAEIAAGREGEYFYDGGVGDLVSKLSTRIEVIAAGEQFECDNRMATSAIKMFGWQSITADLDSALKEIACET